MIVASLMVSDMARSVRFYRDILGMTLTMTVSPEREVGWPGEPSGATFAVLEWDEAQLMLQTVESLAGELAVFAPDHVPAPSGTIYFRGLHPESVRDRVAAEDVAKGPERSWYGMMELYVFRSVPRAGQHGRGCGGNWRRRGWDDERSHYNRDQGE